MDRIRRTTYRVTALTTLTASLVLPLSGARADFYIHAWENQHEAPHEARFNADVGYYGTKNNYDGTGSLIIPVGLQSYSRIQTDLLASYGFSSKFSGYARLGWGRAQLEQATQSSTNFGFTDGTLGLSFRAFDFSSVSKLDGVTIDIQAQADVPLYSTQSTVIPVAGDGTLDFTGGLFATLPIAHFGGSVFSVAGGGGFTYRTASYSRAIPWSVTASIKPRVEGLSFSVQALGLQSLTSDPRASGLSATSTSLSTQTGGSFIANAVNPSIISVRGEVGYQFGPDLGLVAFVSQSVWGLASPNGLYAGAGLRARLGARPKTNGVKLSAQDYGRSNQGFINYGLEAHITRVNDRLNLIKIDKGNQDGVAMNQTFDIFMVKKDGNIGEAVARAHVTSVQQGDAALTVDEYFKEVWIDEGFLAKRPVQ